MSTTRTAVITGAGSERGIGRETALHLADAGFAVAVLDIDGEAAERTAAAAGERGAVPALGLAADVTDAASVGRAVGELESSDLPPVAALVNNAGITRPTRFLDIEQAEWDLVFSVNVTGTYLVTRRVLPGMIERGYGRIVNLSSVSAERGGGVFGGSHYSAAKAAVLGLTRALAREAGPHGVVVNAVAPGLIDTDITGGALAGERKAKLIADIPVGRNGRTEDVAATVTFLAGEHVGYITGATFDINGGSHIQ
ncbi:2-hydroxycyclohexanecarboxyl-CoA dehydrogenase [Saccharopolyspora erythraea NRRL 2338]|uniref:Short-chain dehydrogenase/reductase SDR n=2 Tax=Saccharopolyspora erythraea TaxID=1836 RepID=A4FJ10_SACEN|nr:SDR family NAD(P)-dependent oxidoreductase [Saccharopolyspora erythraea]EQD86142.1 3-ketoacyl-ACP reductase [Saccharopolyspora erythraea D]PFG97705.1 2-hydroxycyclohexanecarboxyl-CoA dehydrogenase [Saccharopolyspora erythraea NRRL 2338]QRK87854.1 SDR family oxidoreductase [Saccharopolyspora erythraea]CAM04035.1 short-chain dehydrogenase/reductase SDR [Saccharopolyspora erythraea NRRL 2338]